MSFAFPKSARLRTRRQYQRIAQNFKRQAGYWIIIDSRQNNQSSTRLGITVTKRFGKAHERNRFKRIVREAFRLCRQQLIHSLDINIKPRTAAKEASMQDVRQEIMHFIGQPKILG